MIDPISQISSIRPEAPLGKTDTVQKPESVFGAVFRDAVDNVKQTEADVAKAEYLLATGQLDNPAELTIAAAKSSIAVDLLVQMRNKAVEAYNELTRTSL